MNIHGFVWEKGMLDFVDDWFPMANMKPVFIIILSYLLFVVKIGPFFMKNRPPYDLKNIIVLYNVTQVALSSYIVYLCCQLLLRHGLWSSTCLLEREDTSMQIATALYYYFLAKVTETLDTVFFVLRKKHNQVTFLHVYHHAVMILTSWAILKHEPTYPMLFMRNLNSFVHIVMYAYYAMSAFPGLAKYLWWKKYITALQVVQLSMIIIHFSVAVMVPGCTPSIYMTFVVLFNTTLMLYLFIQFYLDNYQKRHSSLRESGFEKRHDVVNACG